MNYKLMREAAGMTTLALGIMGCADLSLKYINEKSNEVIGAQEPYSNRLPENFDYASIGLLLASGLILPKESKKSKRNKYSADQK